MDTLGIYADFWRMAFNYKWNSDRDEFWKPLVINSIITIAVYFGVNATYGKTKVFGTIGKADITLAVLVAFAWILLTLLPTAACAVRRMRDTGYSLKNLLWVLLPGIGWAVLIAFMSMDSGAATASKQKRGNPSANRFSAGGCPYCGCPLNGYVTHGSIAEQRVKQNCCPKCGRSLPMNMRVQFK